MNLGYIVSMFPCWSETFILNELVDHRRNGVDPFVYSLRSFSEASIQDDAYLFLKNTIYPLSIYNPYLWLLHFSLILKDSSSYFKILFMLLTFKTANLRIKIKALVVFWLSPIFIKHARKNHLQHLHAHFATYPALLGAIIKSFTSIHFSFTAHAHDIYINQDLLPFICAHADAIVTISNFNKRFLTSKLGKEYNSKISVIRCGIELSKFRFIDKSSPRKSDSPFQLLSIGRLTGIKGFNFLIESVGLLRDEGFKIKCNIIGDGPLKIELYKLVQQLKLDDEIKFLGFYTTEDIVKMLHTCDAFVLACATDGKEGHDGIPIALMEAMASGVPVIGTSLSGIPELIQHHKTGLCAIPENARSLSEQIKYAIENPTKMECMRVKARRSVEANYNIERTASQLRLLYDQVQRGVAS